MKGHLGRPSENKKFQEISERQKADHVVTGKAEEKPKLRKCTKSKSAAKGLMYQQSTETTWMVKGMEGPGD